MAPDTFAGTWYDYRAGRVVVAVVEVLSGDAETRLASTVGLSLDEIEIRSVEHSERELAELRAGARQLMAENPSVVLGAATLIMDNRVSVTIEQARSELGRKLVAELPFAAAVDLQVIDSRQIANAEKSTIKGGHSLRKKNSSGQWRRECSAGPWGFRFVGNELIFLHITAGHCANRMRHGVGHAPTLQKTRENVTGTDSQRMKTTKPQERTNRVHGYGTGEKTMTSVVVAGGSGDRVNDWVCKSGRTSAYTCGQIQSTDYDCTSGNTIMVDYRWATTFSDLGDSGGSVVRAGFVGSSVGYAGLVSSGPVCTSGAPFTDTTYPFQADIASVLQLTGFVIN